MQWRNRVLLAGIMGIALFFHLWGINRDLPYIVDDPLFANAAMRIAVSGNLNPRTFAHPGSTLIYPLAAIYHFWYAGSYGGSWWRPNAQLQKQYIAEPAPFHLLGRLLTVLYAVLSVPLIYWLGRECFGETAALIGALLASLYPSEIFDKMLRTDSASLLFCMIGLCCCLRLYRRPGTTQQLIAGAAIGLAIGTKYYLGTLIAPLLLVDATILWRRKRQSGSWQPWLVACSAGFAAVALGFACSTPYFFIEVARAHADLVYDLHTTHLGADGLSRAGNFYWYLTEALPASLPWPQRAAAAIGIAVALWTRRFQPLLLLFFTLTFLLGISMSALHWQRYLVPVLPVFALFVGYGLHRAVALLSSLRPLPRFVPQALLACGVVIATAQPLQQLIALDRRHSNPSTPVLARQWVEKNLPAGSALAYEWDTLPNPIKFDSLGTGTWINRTNGCNLTELFMSHLSVRGTPSFYAQRGYHYLVTSSLQYGNYPAMPEKYPAEAAFYAELLAKGRLLHQVDPSPTTYGSQIRIYEFR